MGLMKMIFGRGVGEMGKAVADVAEVFVPNKTKAQAEDHAEHLAAQRQFAEEFKQKPGGWFDQFVNGLNRLPRPTMALGTVGLFVYAMVDPASFALRMQGLDEVPEPLWWLLGAIVSFYFGARELHYARQPKRRPKFASLPANLMRSSLASVPTTRNAALEEWRATQRG